MSTDHTPEPTMKPSRPLGPRQLEALTEAASVQTSLQLGFSVRTSRSLVARGLLVDVSGGSEVAFVITAEGIAYLQEHHPEVHIAETHVHLPARAELKPLYIRRTYSTYVHQVIGYGSALDGVWTVGEDSHISSAVFRYAFELADPAEEWIACEADGSAQVKPSELYMRRSDSPLVFRVLGSESREVWLQSPRVPDAPIVRSGCELVEDGWIACASDGEPLVPADPRGRPKTSAELAADRSSLTYQLALARKRSEDPVVRAFYGVDAPGERAVAVGKPEFHEVHLRRSGSQQVFRVLGTDSGGVWMMSVEHSQHPIYRHLKELAGNGWLACDCLGRPQAPEGFTADVVRVSTGTPFRIARVLPNEALLLEWVSDDGVLATASWFQSELRERFTAFARPPLSIMDTAHAAPLGVNR